MERIGFGGGCHWCTEAVFQSLRGVHTVEQGFVRSDPPDDTYSEAVIAIFNPDEINLATLVEVHIRTHASTASHKMRGKYRSAVYTFYDEQCAAVRHVIDQLQSEFEEQIITQVLGFAGFEMSDERFQNYYRNDPTRPFCGTYIDPKLRFLRDRFSRNVHSEESVGWSVECS